MHNPWDTEQGRIARAETFRRLAQGDGELADFAKDVVAGRASPRDLVTSNVLSDGFMDTLRVAVEKWHELPDDDREHRVAGADTAMRERITQLAESAISHQKVRPPDDDELFEQPVVILPDEPWRPDDRG
jgi:hypothetical protein